MRVGFNPNKDQPLQKSEYFHQIIVPVYIPNHEGYFRDSFKILQFCLESLFKTTHINTYFSIVNNGSCTEVSDYLNNLKRQNKIQELIETSAIGKLNAIFKGLSGHQFPLITIADADVLFKSEWQQATYQVFEHFPKAGAVSPVPSSKMFNYYTENIISKLMFSRKLQFSNVVNPNAMKAFAESVGNTEFYKEIHLKKYLTIDKGGFKAVVGASHFICTYRQEVFENQNQNFTNYMLGGNCMGKFLDKSVVDKNLWRLSTEDNFAFHMGNVVEDWMVKTFEDISEEKAVFDSTNFIKIKSRKFNLLNKVFSKLMAHKNFRLYFLKFKGLTKQQAANY